MLAKIRQCLLPTICCLCAHPSLEDICVACQGLLPWLYNRCYQCGLYLESREESIRCRHCTESPPSFDRVCAAFCYEPPLPKMLARFKFSGQLAYGRVLGDILADQAEKHWCKPEGVPQAIVPVPLHAKRLAKRGFNQAYEISLLLNRRLGIPILSEVCVRQKNTLPQLSLDKFYRKKNVDQAFLLKSKVSCEHVVIVDDVVTTGNTVKALSILLKEAGVQQVDVWSVCRA